jgi:ubiquinone/menaquinone biosynthesis C-methylase UbiE
MAFHEIIRILKPGGRFCISDVVTVGSIPESLKEQAELYAGCVAGALPIEQYLNIISKIGFRHVEVKKKKLIEIPEALLNEFLSKEEIETLTASGVGIYSITVTGEKPSCLCGCDC